MSSELSAESEWGKVDFLLIRLFFFFLQVDIFIFFNFILFLNFT